jgi:hypothetical protein
MDFMQAHGVMVMDGLHEIHGVMVMDGCMQAMG